jgi:polysaccharide deacetylase 2 family uncharacterized protein YibQ
MAKRKKRKHGKPKTTPKHFFVLFIAVALVTVVLLEYIDFRKGKKSFIFTTLIPLKKVSKKVDTFNNNFIRILNKNNISYEYSQDADKKYHFQLEIDAKRYKGLLDKLKNVTGNLKGKIELVEVQGMENKSIMLYKVLLDAKITHLVLITKIKKVKPRKTPKDKPKDKETPVQKVEKTPLHRTPRIAFIIDDVGVYDIGALELKRLNIPITASILPDSPYAREEARWVREYGIPALLHIPMQPKNGNGQTYHRNGTITMQSSDDEIRRLIRRAKEIVPAAEGVNNHQGSLVTASSSVMTRTLKIIKEEGLFFVDSRTIGNTVAYDIAKRLGIKTTYKDVFIDHIKSYSHSVSQIRRLVEIAMQKGKAIAIGHPNDSTFRAIRDSIKFIRARGVKIVYVSELLE